MASMVKTLLGTMAIGKKPSLLGMMKKRITTIIALAFLLALDISHKLFGSILLKLVVESVIAQMDPSILAATIHLATLWVNSRITSCQTSFNVSIIMYHLIYMYPYMPISFIQYKEVNSGIPQNESTILYVSSSMKMCICFHGHWSKCSV